MQVYLKISEMALTEVSDNRFYGIYPSLIDIYADTLNKLNDITTVLMIKGLFDFSNAGTYAGIHPNKMHFTYDDGKQGVDWIMQLLKTIAEYNHLYKTNIQLKIVKKDIEDSNGIALFKGNRAEYITGHKLDKYMKEYVTILQALLKRYRIYNVLDTKIQPIEDKKQIHFKPINNMIVVHR